MIERTSRQFKLPATKETKTYKKIALLFSERVIGLPDSMLKNKSCPQVVPSLEGLFIEDIAVGSDHVLAMSSTGDVYAWGCNSNGQVIGVL